MRIRTISQAYKEIRTADPDTAVTEYRIRQLVIEGIIPSTKAGSRYLVDLDRIQTYFATGGA